MHCNTLIEPACRAAGTVIHSVTASAAGDVLGGIAQAITTGVRWIVENTATWWLRIPSPDLATEPAVARIPQWLLPTTAASALGRLSGIPGITLYGPPAERRAPQLSDGDRAQALEPRVDLLHAPHDSDHTLARLRAVEAGAHQLQVRAGAEHVERAANPQHADRGIALDLLDDLRQPLHPGLVYGIDRRP